MTTKTKPRITLVPLMGQISQRQRTEFVREYDKARKKDPIVFPPVGRILERVRSSGTIAALVESDGKVTGCFVLDVDRDHDAICCIVAAGKDFPDWADAMEAMAQKAARALGLKRLWLQGRTGWGPTCKKRGFERKYVVYAKELS